MPNTESNTLRYKSGRIPVIALDYSSRQLAQKRELLVDYKNAKLYVVSAEDRTVIYDLTSNIIKAFKESGGASDFTIEIEGLGTYKLGDIINQLYTSKIDLIEDKEFQYNAPTVSFDNKSLAIYDRQASMLNFNRANDRTVPMKKDDALVWMPFDLENLENRLLKLENTSVPDIEEWKSFRIRLAAVEATDELYKDLPNMKANISINAAGIKDLSDRVNALDINTVKDNITTLTNTVNTHNAKIKTDEAKLELLTKKVNDDDAILQLLEERANTNLATLTDLLSRTTKLENINANDRLSTVENDIVNINSQLASVASSENISNIDERLHALEDKYPVDISSLTTDVTALKTKTATHDSAIPELQEKVATLEQNVTSLSGIDIDQINNNIDQKVNSIKQTVDSYTQTSASLQTLVDQLKTSVDAIPVYTAGDGIKISSANEISLNHVLATVDGEDHSSNRIKTTYELHNTDTSYIFGGSYNINSALFLSEKYTGDNYNLKTDGGIFNSDYATMVGGGGGLIVDSDNATIVGNNRGEIYGSKLATIVGGYSNEIYSSTGGATVLGSNSASIEFTNYTNTIVGAVNGGTIDSASSSLIIGNGTITGSNSSGSMSVGGNRNLIDNGCYGTVIGGLGNINSYNTTFDLPFRTLNTAKVESDYNTRTSLKRLSECMTHGDYYSSYGELSLGGIDNTVSGDGSVNIGGNKSKVWGAFNVNVGGYGNFLFGNQAVTVGGYNSIAEGYSSVAVGGGYSKSSNTIAIGPGAVSYYLDSDVDGEKLNSNIAIGLESVAKENGVISFGHKAGDIAPFYVVKDEENIASLDDFKTSITSSLKSLAKMVSEGYKPYGPEMHWPLISFKENLNKNGIFNYSTKGIAELVATRDDSTDTYTAITDDKIKEFVDGLNPLLYGVKKIDNTYTEDFYNRLVNAADGISAHDVATVGQTIALTNGDNITITEDGANDIGQKKFKISANIKQTPLTIDNIESVITADVTRVVNYSYAKTSASNGYNYNGYTFYDYKFKDDFSLDNKQFLYLDTTDNKIKLLKFSQFNNN